MNWSSTWPTYSDTASWLVATAGACSRSMAAWSICTHTAQQAEQRDPVQNRYLLAVIRGIQSQQQVTSVLRNSSTRWPLISLQFTVDSPRVRCSLTASPPPAPPPPRPRRPSPGPHHWSAPRHWCLPRRHHPRWVVLPGRGPRPRAPGREPRQARQWTAWRRRAARRRGAARWKS